MMIIVPFWWLAFTFLTSKFALIASCKWLSHIEHIIPSIASVVFTIYFESPADEQLPPQEEQSPVQPPPFLFTRLLMMRATITISTASTMIVYIFCFRNSITRITSFCYVINYFVLTVNLLSSYLFFLKSK